MSEFKNQGSEQEVYGWITVEPDGDGGEQRDFKKGSLRPDFGIIPLYTQPSAETERLKVELAEAKELLRDVQENGETNENSARIGNFLSAGAQPAEVDSNEQQS